MKQAGTGAVLWFADIGRVDTLAVGGKGASLGELTRAGIRVPPGFVVSTSAFGQFMDAADPGGSLRREIAALDHEDLDGIRQVTRRVRQRVVQSPMPGPLQEKIEAAFRQLIASCGAEAVAVRSSATSEDSEEASFAGLQDTYLWVLAGEVPDRIRSCWASLYNAESVAYRRRLDLPEDQLGMGVVVQAMLDSRCAGVMFSRSPTTGDKSVVTLEGSWGLGSSIVSGEVTPDKWVVNKVTGEIMDRVIARKAIQHVRDRGGSGVLVEDVPASRCESPCLTDAQIGELVGLARRCEKHYGCAQDMEWAVTEPDGIYLLQSRPETIWSNRRREAISQPKTRAFDHVFSVLGRIHDE